MIAGPVPEHVLASPPAVALEWATASLGQDARLMEVEPLTRSRWLANHLLTYATDAGDWQVVLRRWARPGWDRLDPDFDAAREATALELIAPHVPAPRVIASDPTGLVADVPALLLTVVPGSTAPTSPQLDGFVTELARGLASVHAVPVKADALPAYRPWHDLPSRPRPAWIPRTPPWDRLWELGRERRPGREQVLIHRDYHHGNTLWSGERLTGILDWTTASIGPRGVDVAHARWNLALAFGAEAAAAFLDAYRETAPGYRHDPYRDAVQLVDWVNDIGLEPARFERLDRYVTEAMRL